MSEIKTFEAICLTPEGWTVLSPWAKALDGKEYRQHCGEFGKDEVFAKYMAAQLNRLSTSPAAARLIEACRHAQKRMNRCDYAMKVEDVAALDAVWAALKAVEEDSHV
jgi:hypothetical protein